MATLSYSLSSVVRYDGKARVLVRLSVARGVKPRAKTEIYINPARWSAEEGRIVIPRINNAEQRELIATKHALDELTNHIYQAAAELRKPADATTEWLTRCIEQFHHPEEQEAEEQPEQDIFEAFDRFLSVKRYSRFRDASFRQVARCLQRWGAIRERSVSFDTITERSLLDFELFLRDEHRYATDEAYAPQYEHARDAREERGQNTINGLLTRLRTFYRWANEQGLTKNNPFLRFKVKECIYGTPYYLTLDERRQLLEADMPSKPLEAIRDIFVFQCCVGCRVGDLTNLSPKNIVNGALEYIPRKTKEGNPVTVRVPLNGTALALIEKWSEGDRLLPFVADAYYNRALKECFTAAGLTRSVTTIDPKTRQEVQRPLNEIASSHLARRTFIGNLYKQLKDPNIIASMSGHREGSRAFARYRAIDDTIKAEAVALLD